VGPAWWSPRAVWALRWDRAKRTAFYLGLGIFGLSAAYGMFSIVAHLLGRTPPGWTSMVVSVLAIGGLQMTVIGLTGGYLARVFDEVKGRPNGLLKTPGSSRRPRPTIPDTN
jgi:hypothetical protein